MKRVFFFVVLMSVASSAHAQVEVIIDHMFVRELHLTKTEEIGPQGGSLFQVLTEEQWAGYVYDIRSAKKSQPLIEHDKSLFERVKIYLDVEMWEIKQSQSGEFKAVSFKDETSKTLNSDQYNSLQEGLKAEAFFRTAESFVTKELPHLEQNKAVAQVEISQPARVECTAISAQDMQCRQVIQLRYRLKSDDYEKFRSRGIEPVLVLRGKNEEA